MSSADFNHSAASIQADLDTGFALYAAGLYREAMQAFEAAARRDNAAAQEILGMMHLKGETLYRDVPTDEASAAYWLRRAAACGSRVALLQIAYLDQRATSAQE